MRKITRRMAREILRIGFVDTKKYCYYEDVEYGNIYRVPVEILDTTEVLKYYNREFVCKHEELCDLAF